jgi:3-oxoacyl-(acyl-carrier-protein) synthase
VGRIFVTGIGLISSIGEQVSANKQALKDGKCGISSVELFATRYADLLPFAEIKIDNQEFRNRLKIGDPSVTRTSLLALHALKEAIEDGGLSAAQLASEDCALVGATSVGGMCLTDELYQDSNRQNLTSPYLQSYDSASVMLCLQKHHQVGGVVNTINTACSSSANAIMYGARLIKHGYAKRAIVGGADSLAKFTINGFNSLVILSSEKCKPFDKGRSGLNLGEGAAFLVLEREEDCQGKKVYAEVRGYANANDAYHPSSLSDNGDGPYLAMQGALQSAGLQPSDIDYINAHGTGTENNDLVESTAMKALFGTPPPFSSTKSNTGHTLGAAGAIEAVFSLLNLTGQELYASLSFKEPITETGLSPVLSYTKKEINHVMSNSFGFGGNCSSLVFSKV